MVPQQAICRDSTESYKEAQSGSKMSPLGNNMLKIMHQDLSPQVVQSKSLVRPDSFENSRWLSEVHHVVQLTTTRMRSEQPTNPSTSIL